MSMRVLTKDRTCLEITLLLAVIAATVIALLVVASGCTAARIDPPEPPAPAEYRIAINQGDTTFFATVTRDMQEINLPAPDPIIIERVDTVYVDPPESYRVDIELFGGTRTAVISSDTSFAITNLAPDTNYLGVDVTAWEPYYHYVRSKSIGIGTDNHHHTVVDVLVEPFQVRQMWFHRNELIATHYVTEGEWEWPGGAGQSLPADVWERLNTTRRELER